jgi:hypothetical protein
LERYLRAADILLSSAFLQALYGAFVLSFLLGTHSAIGDPCFKRLPEKRRTRVPSAASLA